MPERLKQLLSLRFCSVLIVLISIAGRVTQKLSFAGLDDDKCYQIQATKNLLNGHGISILEVNANEISSSHYAPLIKWPPAYSLFLAPFLAMSGNDYLWGSIWLDILASILFVLLARSLIKQFEVPAWLVNLYTLVAGFYLFDFVSTNSTDLLTLVFFQAAMLFTLKLLRSKDHYKRNFYLSILFLFLCAAMRYMYAPVVLVVPAFIYLSGHINKNIDWKRSGMFMFAGLIILIGMLLYFQKATGGSATYVSPSAKGFFPENIFATVPFLYAAAANLGPPVTAFQEATGADLRLLTNLIVYSHLIILLVIIILSLRWMIKDRFRSTDLWSQFSYLTFFSSLAVLGVLGILSVMYEKFHLISGLNWTYLTEPRYFAVPIFFVQIWLILAVYRNYKNRRWKRSWAILALTPLFLSAAHSFYFTLKKLNEGKSAFMEKRELVLLDSCKDFFHHFVAANPDKTIICVSGDPMFNNFAALWEKIPGLYDIEKLNTLDLPSAQSVIIFVPVKPWYEARLKSFLENPSKKFLGQIADWKFYSIEISR